jgi:hypothetical protein
MTFGRARTSCASQPPSPSPIVTSSCHGEGSTAAIRSTGFECSTTSGEPPPFCGDGELDDGEECDELYFAIFGDLAFYVLDTTSDEVVRQFEVGLPAHRQFGVYLDGSFYTYVDWKGSLERIDAYDGTYEDTGVTPTSTFPGAAVNPATHEIYLSGADDQIDHFEVYDTLEGTLTTLASPPVGPSSSYTSLLLMFPGG